MNESTTHLTGILRRVLPTLVFLASVLSVAMIWPAERAWGDGPVKRGSSQPAAKSGENTRDDDGGIAGGTPALDVINSWGGPVQDVEVVGNTAYMTIGRRLVVVDISNPATMTQVGSVDVGANAREVAIRNNYAYITMGGRGAAAAFCVVNISNPASPTVVWQTPQPWTGFSRDFKEIRLHGNYAYLREGTYDSSDGWIVVYDITQPAAPVHVGHLTNLVDFNNQYVKGIEIAGDRLYTVSVFGPSLHVELSIYDLNAGTILEPALLGTFNVGLYYTGIPYLAVDGDYAYVSNAKYHIDPGPDSWINVINVSNPAAPSLVSNSITFSYNSPPNVARPYEVSAHGGHVYVTWNPGVGIQRNALRVYDVASNPAAPVELTPFVTHGDIRTIVFSGGLGWVLDDGEGAIALNVSNPAALVRLGKHYSPAILRDMKKVGNLLYVLDAWNGFTILDVSNPAAGPSVVGVFQTPATHPSTLSSNWSSNYGLDVAGNRVYLSAGYSGFMVVDVTNPAAPSLIFTDAPPGSCLTARCVRVKNNVVHVTFYACGSTWVYRTYDAQTLALLAHRVFDPGSGFGPDSIAINGAGLLFTGAQTTQIVNASDPTNPFMLNVNTGTSYGRNLVLLNDTTRLMSKEGPPTQPASEGLYIHNVQNPASPSLVSFSWLDEAGALAVQGNRVYVTRPFQSGGMLPGCTVFDISNPAKPQPIASVANVAGNATSDNQTNLVVDEPYVFVSNGHDTWAACGLIILRGENLDLPPPSGEQSKMYWVENSSNTIKRANIDGTELETLINGTDIPGFLSPVGLALDVAAGKMYFTHTVSGLSAPQSIRRANLDGSNIETLVVGSFDQFSPPRLAIDVAGGKIYWYTGTSNSGAISRANLDGSNQQIIINQPALTGLAIDPVAHKLYFSYRPNLSCPNGTVQSANLDGAGITTILTGISGLRMLTIDRQAGKLYWIGTPTCSSASVFRANLDGTSVETVLTPPSSMSDLALDPQGGFIYLTGSSAVRRAKMDGTGLTTIISQLSFPLQIGLDLIPIPCPADVAPPGGNGVVNIDDLLLVINHWGQCVPPPSSLGGGKSGTGDMNCDGVTNRDDIEPFMLAINDFPAYLDAYFPPCTTFNGDMNGDGTFTSDDLPLFCQFVGGLLLGNQCYAQSPCPGDIMPLPTGNGSVNIDDLLKVINSWGVCH